MNSSRKESTRVSGSTTTLLSEAFQKLGKFYQSKNDTYRSKTFFNAAKVIRDLKVRNDSEIIPVLSKIKGIGKGVIKRVEEFYQFKTFQDEGFSSFSMKEEEKLPKLYGIGPAKLREIERLNIKTIEELRESYFNNIIDLTPSQIFGLEYYSDLNERIPRTEVKKLGEKIISVISKISPFNISEIVGSYRRGLMNSGDVDILLSNEKGENTLPQIIEELKNKGIITFIFGLGEVSFHGVGRVNKNGKMRKIDIRYIRKEEWESALLHYTGSAEFNVYLRGLAIEKGMTLSEHGLFQNGVRITKSSTPESETFLKENEIIHFLTGRDYTPPEREFSSQKSNFSSDIDSILALLNTIDEKTKERELSLYEKEELLNFSEILAYYSKIFVK